LIQVKPASSAGIIGDLSFFLSKLSPNGVLSCRSRTAISVSPRGDAADR